MKKIARIFLIILLFLTSINALIAGLLFIIEPSGKLMGMTIEYIKNSPFQSFLIPGIVLFTFNGILNLLAGIAVILKKWYAAYFAIIQGVILVSWIVIQMIMVQDFNMLHLIMFIIGTLLIVGGIIIRKSK